MDRPDSQSLPAFLAEVVASFVGTAGAPELIAQMRAPHDVMTAPSLSALKATRLSFANVLAQHMIEERWTVRRERFRCDDEGDAYGVYRIDAGGHPLTYIARCYRWDGVEKVGRRSDGGMRDMFGAIFLGTPDDQRIQQEFAVFDQPENDVFNLRDNPHMRTRSDVTGWTPASRSSRYFDHVVDALVDGRQPDPAFLGAGTGYILRNGGYLGSGRQGSLSLQGLPADHPFRHPFFADLFGLCMVRRVSIDLVNAVAQARNPAAAELDPEIARYIGVGNSSGQGMCVALQRWPEWVSAWLTVRELALAHAVTRPVTTTDAARLTHAIERVRDYLGSIELQCEDYVVPPRVIADNLGRVLQWLDVERASLTVWGDLAGRAERELDRESYEQLNALLIDLYPDFADAVSGYLVHGAWRNRDVSAEMRVGVLKSLLRSQYGWALRIDQRHSRSRQYFWYHSIDSGEQRRGERIVDPHEDFESFVDHIGLVQRLACVLASYPDDIPVAEVLMDLPDLYYAVARVQYLAGLPYAEIRDNLIDARFIPAHLIRFYLVILGVECTSPLSTRYVRGVFFQGLPDFDEIADGARSTWRFPALPEQRVPEGVA